MYVHLSYGLPFELVHPLLRVHFLRRLLLGMGESPTCPTCESESRGDLKRIGVSLVSVQQVVLLVPWMAREKNAWTIF